MTLLPLAPANKYSTTIILVKCTQMCIMYCSGLMPTTNLTVLWFCKVLCIIAHHANSSLGDRRFISQYFTYCCWANIHSSKFKLQKFRGEPYKMCTQKKTQQKMERKFGSLNAPGMLHVPQHPAAKAHIHQAIHSLVCCILCSYNHNWQTLLRLGNEGVGQFFS